MANHDRRRLYDFLIYALALHEQQLSPRPQQWSNQGDECFEGAHCTCRDLIDGHLAHNILRTLIHDRDIAQAQPSRLVNQPGRPTPQGLDKYALDIRPHSRENEPRKAGARTNIGQRPGIQ
jgi:hypothetical protein